MKGIIELKIDNSTIGTIDADDHPALFLDLVQKAHSNGTSYVMPPQAAPGVVQGAKTNGTNGHTKKAKTGVVNTRTQEGRDAYDKKILAEIGSEPHTVEELAPPGTPEQIRTSLHRLVEAKMVKRTGQARGTRYQILAKGVAARKK